MVAFVDLKHRKANSEDPDEMPHNMAFHLGLHFCKDKIDLQRKYTILWEIIACVPSIYTMKNPNFFYAFSFMESSIGQKKVEQVPWLELYKI